MFNLHSVIFGICLTQSIAKVATFPNPRACFGHVYNSLVQMGADHTSHNSASNPLVKFTGPLLGSENSHDLILEVRVLILFPSFPKPLWCVWLLLSALYTLQSWSVSTTLIGCSRLWDCGRWLGKASLLLLSHHTLKINHLLMHLRRVVAMSKHQAARLPNQLLVSFFQQVLPITFTTWGWLVEMSVVPSIWDGIYLHLSVSKLLRVLKPVCIRPAKYYWENEYLVLE